MEEWKDIVGFEGIYQISNFGRVKSLKGHEKFLKPGKNKNGYLSVILYKNKKSKKFLIHRLVAITFLKNPKNKPCVNHLDCDPTNNRVDNLEWCTAKENSQYMMKMGRGKAIENLEKTKTKRNQAIIKKCAKPVIAININTGEQTYFESQKEAARRLNLSVGNINSVLKSRIKYTGNYFFKYVNENKQENTLF